MNDERRAISNKQWAMGNGQVKGWDRSIFLWTLSGGICCNTITGGIATVIISLVIATADIICY